MSGDEKEKKSRDERDCEMKLIFSLAKKDTGGAISTQEDNARL